MTETDKIKKVCRWNRLSEQGNTMVLVAIILPALIAATGLALDWGRGVSTQTQLQRAADAGALAGASAYPDIEMADDVVLQIVNSNFEDPDETTFTCTLNRYKVELSEDVPMLFMKIFGWDSLEVKVTATAVANRPVGGLRGGGFPFGIINPEYNDDPCDDFTEWNYGKVYIVGYGEDNVMVEDWANGCDPPPTSPGHGGGNSEGWRGILGLNSDGTYGNCGGSDLRDNLEFGWPGIMLIGDEVPMKFGNMAGPTRDGREALLGDDPMSWDDFDPEIHGDSNRVVLVPIVHLINESRGDTYTVQDWLNGADWDHGTVIVDGFAPFFLLTQEEYEPYLDVQGNPHDWMVGFFVPGVETDHFYEPDDDNPDYGMYSPPRLID